MTAKTRKRKPIVEVPLISIYPGCCNPYPDATFVNQKIVKLVAHHRGPQCKGFLEPMSIEDWNASIALRRDER